MFKIGKKDEHPANSNILQFPGPGENVGGDGATEKKVTVFDYERLVGKICRSKEFCKTGMVLAVKKDSKDRVQYLVSDVDAGLGLISEKDLLEKWEIEN